MAINPSTYYYDPKKETAAEYFARTQSAINVDNPNEAPIPTTLPTLPQGGGATPTPLPGQTPDLGSTDPQSGNLLAFKDALAKVGELARSTRNGLMSQFQQQFKGTVRASDFNQLNHSIDSSSDTTFQDYINNRIAPEVKAANDTPDIVTATSDNGDVHGINRATGKVIWTAKGVGNQQRASSPKANTHYTATSIPNDVKTDLIADMQHATLQDIYGAYPDVSTSYINSLYNSLHKTSDLASQIEAAFGSQESSTPSTGGIDWNALNLKK